MFGMGGRANYLSQSRQGNTTIKRPSTGRENKFGNLRAGDFFSYEGRLYLKINLVDGVEVPDGQTPIIGTSQFSENCQVQAENVEILIK